MNSTLDEPLVLCNGGGQVMATSNGTDTQVDGFTEVGVRRLTPTECERLQGFPDGWTEGQADSVRYRQLGNAVAVPVVEWIAERIMAYERGELARLESGTH